MKYLSLLCLLIAGCVCGSRENLRTLEEAPASDDSTLASILREPVPEISVAPMPAPSVKQEPVKPPVLAPRKKKVAPARHDSITVIDWPDDEPYRFIFVARNLDTQGNPINANVRLQIEQFNRDTSSGWLDMNDRIDRSESDYWVRNDTLYVNVPYLRKFNPSPAGEYIYDWRFRIRLEDFFDTRKNSGWVYARKVLNLVRADRWAGVPQRPIFIEAH